MKTKIVVLMLVLVMLFSIAACAKPEDANTKYTMLEYDDFIIPQEYNLMEIKDTEIECNVGEEFEISLVHNSGTSQEWNYHIEGDAVKFVDVKTSIPEGEELVAGGEVNYYYCFSCNKPGIVTITFTEDDFVNEKTWQTVSFTVKVN